MSYHHLPMDERNVIHRIQFQGYSQVETARCLGSGGNQPERRRGPGTWATLWVTHAAFPFPCSWRKAINLRGLGTEYPESNSNDTLSVHS
jgi:hypothetical protein